MCPCSWELNSDECRGLAMKCHNVEVTVGLDNSDRCSEVGAMAEGEPVKE